MKYAFIVLATLCFVLTPRSADAQASSSTNLNDCLVSTFPPLDPGDTSIDAVIEVSGDASPTVPLCGLVLVSDFQVTFPTDIVSGAAIDAYNLGLWDGVDTIPVTVNLRVGATNASPAERLIVTNNYSLAIQIAGPPGSEWIEPADATVPLPTFGWTPTGGDIVIELSQGTFEIGNVATSVFCQPYLPVDSFASITVTLPSCDPVVDCNFPQGDCHPCGNCDCSAGWTGLNCSDPTCDPVEDCNFPQGDCDAGVCVCGAGYTGADCSIETCTTECNGAPVGIAEAYNRIVCTDEPCAVTGGLTVLDGSTLTFQDLDLPVFDQGSINLGLAVGGMTVPTIQPPDPVLSSFVAAANPQTSPESGTFRIEYLSDAAGTLNILALGDAVCPPDEQNDPEGLCRPQDGEPYYEPWDATYVTTDANISGSLVGSLPGQLPTVLNGAPVTYALDGYTVCGTIIGATECSGTAYLNAFLGFLTEPGTKIPVTVSQIYVDPADSTGETVIPVNLGITYDAILPSPQDPFGPVFTTVVTTSEAAGSISSNYKIEGLGFTPVFFDITTNGVVAGPVTVCAEYQEPGPTVVECNLRLLHNDDVDPNEFIDITELLPEDDPDCKFHEDPSVTCNTNGWCINPTSNEVCGRTLTGLSPFTVAEFVGNNAPVIDAVNVTPVPEAVGQPVTAAVSLCDPDSGQTLYIDVDWGDNVVTQRAAPAEACDPYQLVEDTHAYTEAGVYTVIVTVSDSDGDSDSQVFQFAVIYDPTGGFVTGGGWINSPEGAYAPDPNLTGKANFGFVSKYKKGANVPTGNTEFQFKAGDLNFKSTSYDWLVIAGSKAKFKGDGTINGDGNYGFMLTAADSALPGGGESDTFRIKIWDKDNGDVVVYDNQMGDGDDADATTALGGGSIVIHKAK